MEHARKMVLVPEENLSQLSAQNQRQAVFNDSTVSPEIRAIGTTLSRLDTEMNDILKCTTYKDDREKWSAYLTVLQRYLHFADSERAQQYLALAKTNENPTQISEKKKKNNSTHLHDSVIIESIPAKYRTKAKLLLRRLHDVHEPNFSWNSAGVVSIDGKPIKESNIVDLVNDAMRARKAPKPIGRKAFAQFLRKIQAPREFVGNEELWAESRANSTMQPIASGDSNGGGGEDDSEEEEDISDIEAEFYSDTYQSGRSGESDSSRPSPIRKSKRRIQSGGSEPNHKIKRVTWSSLKL